MVVSLKEMQKEPSTPLFAPSFAIAYNREHDICDRIFISILE